MKKTLPILFLGASLLAGCISSSPATMPLPTTSQLLTLNHKVAGDIAYFLKNPPKTSQELKANLNVGYYQELNTRLQTANPEADARAAIARGERYLLGILNDSANNGKLAAAYRPWQFSPHVAVIPYMGRAFRDAIENQPPFEPILPQLLMDKWANRDCPIKLLEGANAMDGRYQVPGTNIVKFHLLEELPGRFVPLNTGEDIMSGDVKDGVDIAGILITYIHTTTFDYGSRWNEAMLSVCHKGTAP
ncbi:hypothetical protein SAMN05660964_01713 [Thiothrix caldifontis]|uniref:Uncharacterized protein n=1 Tax=Thiothrix caldifontis TaxID=525918 RepID=A0A1H4BM24_9GAMM|nr:hypothetical protein [Thiothrix caldifontis]SEA49098.1 hypothetical protein SAMN05660964_01713 [Thiothrix caldifontis]